MLCLPGVSAAMQKSCLMSMDSPLSTFARAAIYIRQLFAAISRPRENRGGFKTYDVCSQKLYVAI
jgi:hypothetical protein